MMRTSKRGEKGIQLAEMAIAAPILLLIMAAIAEFGNYFHHYNTLSKATRAGARYLSSKPYTAGERDKARFLMICGNPDGCNGATPILPGLTTSNIQVVATGGTTFLPHLITVNIVNYNYMSVFNVKQLAGSGDWISVPVKPSTTIRYLLEN
jgi:Flp pilus assembly protein TadG